MRVTVLGTGTMGAGVARSLLREGHTVTVWNRSADKAAPLGDDGAAVASDAASAVADAEVVLLTLFDTDAVVDVLEAAAGDAPSGAVWVQASTVGVAGTETLVQLAEKYGITLVEAMMLGTKGPAEQGKLTMLAAGPADVLDRIDPVRSPRTRGSRRSRRRPGSPWRSLARSDSIRHCSSTRSTAPRATRPTRTRRARR